SGTQTRSVTCRRSDGATVSNSYCGSGQPAASQSCTPTSGYSCGTQGATTRSTTLTNACTGSAQVSTLNCGSAGIGTSKSCSGTVTVTAVGGPITLRPQAELYAVSGAT